MHNERTARRNGKKDGKRGIPCVSDAKHSDYVCKLLQAGEDNIKDVVKNYYAFMSKKEGGLNTVKASLDAKNEALDKKKILIERFDEKVPLGQFGYWFIVIFIFLAETPVNFMAFSIFESPVFSAILAVGISGGIPLIAHFLGAWFKEGRRGWTKAHVIKLCVILVITIAAILSIAYVREKLFETDEDIRKIMDPSALTFVFISINLFLFALATVASKFAHYSNPDIPVHMKEYNKLLNEGNELSGSYHLIRADIVNTAKKFRTEAEQIVDRVESLIDTYEQENTRARYEGFLKRAFNAVIFWDREYLRKKDPERPPVFDNYPVIVIPPAFLKDVEQVINGHPSPTVMIPQNLSEDVQSIINEHQQS